MTVLTVPTVLYCTVLYYVLYCTRDRSKLGTTRPEARAGPPPAEKGDRGSGDGPAAPAQRGGDGGAAPASRAPPRGAQGPRAVNLSKRHDKRTKQKTTYKCNQDIRNLTPQPPSSARARRQPPAPRTPSSRPSYGPSYGPSYDPATDPSSRPDDPSSYPVKPPQQVTPSGHLVKLPRQVTPSNQP